MAIQETNLGHFDYLAFYTKDADITLNGAAATNWKWQVPTHINRRKAPYWFLSVQSCYCDDSTGASNGRPHFLRCKVPADNYYTYEKNTNGGTQINYPIVSNLIRDVPTGHWYSISQDNVVIQVPSNLQFIEFDIVDAWGSVLPINSDANNGESLTVICKITYPARNEVMDNTNHTFIQTIDAKQTPKFAFTN
jgi:hypothetical protein